MEDILKLLEMKRFVKFRHVNSPTNNYDFMLIAGEPGAALTLVAGIGLVCFDNEDVEKVVNQFNLATQDYIRS